MKRPWQPEWASEEESRLAREWSSSESNMDIVDYIKAHASERLLKEYARQDKYLKGKKGTEIMPNGEIITHNAYVKPYYREEESN